MALPYTPTAGQNISASGVLSDLQYLETRSALAALFAQDTVATTGLTFGYQAGRVKNGATVTDVAAGTILLPASQTNVYIEVNSAGVVSQNTTGFTATSKPIGRATTDGGSITDFEDKRVDFDFDGGGGGDADTLQGQDSAHHLNRANHTGTQAQSTVTNLVSDLALKADLVSGTVPAAQLPSYVDDVLEYADFASLPGTGTTGKIYVTLDTNKTYRWSGSTYVEISPDTTDIAGQTESTSPLSTWFGIFYDLTGNKKVTLANIFTLFLSASRTFAENVFVTKSQNAPTGVAITNSAALGNTSASAIVSIASVDSSGGFGAYPSDYVTAILRDRVAFSANSTASGIAITAIASGQDIRLHVGSSSETARWTSGGMNIGGAANPHASALLELTSTAKGLLPPRMTTAQRDLISSPATGLLIYNTTTAQYEHYSGSAWIATGPASSGIPATTVDAKGDLLVGTADNTVARQAVGTIGQMICADSAQTNGLKWFGGHDTLTDGATVTWDMANRPQAHATVVLGGNRTLAISNVVAGAYGVLIVKQDATGNRTLALPAGSKVVDGGAGAITLSTAANAIDAISFIYDGSTLYFSYGKNFS